MYRYIPQSLRIIRPINRIYKYMYQKTVIITVILTIDTLLWNFEYTIYKRIKKMPSNLTLSRTHRDATTQHKIICQRCSSELSNKIHAAQIWMCVCVCARKLLGGGFAMREKFTHTKNILIMSEARACGRSELKLIHCMHAIYDLYMRADDMKIAVVVSYHFHISNDKISSLSFFLLAIFKYTLCIIYTTYSVG